MNNIKHKNEGERVLFQSERGEISLRSDFDAETLWITQRQLAEVFAVDIRTVNEHISNIFKTRELDEESVIRIFRITAADGKKYNTKHYNLDMAISVGYRVNSAKATKFRKWATEVLRSHIVDGYTINANRLKNRQRDVQHAIENLQHLQNQTEVLDVDQTLELIKAYAQAWLTLDRFDRAELTSTGITADAKLDVGELNRAISTFRSELIKKGEASQLFATEKEQGALKGIIGNVTLPVFGTDVYPTLEEKAAHLLYFIVKNHPFNDGNKRTGAFSFIWFLQANGWNVRKLPETALTALTLLIATSKPSDKKRMISLILELLRYK